jgi:hypothetical protein
MRFHEAVADWQLIEEPGNPMAYRYSFQFGNDENYELCFEKTFDGFDVALYKNQMLLTNSKVPVWPDLGPIVPHAVNQEMQRQREQELIDAVVSGKAAELFYRGDGT